MGGSQSHEEAAAEGIAAGAGSAAGAGGAASAASACAGATGLRGACPRSPREKDHVVVCGAGHREAEAGEADAASEKRPVLHRCQHCAAAECQRGTCLAVGMARGCVQQVRSKLFWQGWMQEAHMVPACALARLSPQPESLTFRNNKFPH